MTDRSDPFAEIEELFERMSREFDGFGGGLESRARGSDVDIDVAETDDAVVVTADVPGFEKTDVEVTVSEDVLTVSAERTGREEAGDPDRRYHRRERSHALSRRVRLPAAVDEAAASAGYEHGVVTVTLPKRDPEAGGGERIDIK